MAVSNQLEIPEIAKQDANSLELLRVWVANKGQHVSLRVGIWKDPAFWGVMLADLARHVVNSYHDDQGWDKEAILQRIRAGFDAELTSPTDHPTGR